MRLETKFLRLSGLGGVRHPVWRLAGVLDRWMGQIQALFRGDACEDSPSGLSPRLRRSDTDQGGLLSGAVYPVFGKYEKAIETAKGVIRLDPDFGFAYVNLAYAYLNSNQFEEAAKVNTLAAERNLEIPDFLVERYLLAFLNDDRPGMDR